jgi:hypothetical protein
MIDSIIAYHSPIHFTTSGVITQDPLWSFHSLSQNDKKVETLTKQLKHHLDKKTAGPFDMLLSNTPDFRLSKRSLCDVLS